MLTGMENMAETLAEALTQVIVLHKLPQRIALADRERQALLFQTVTFHLFL